MTRFWIALGALAAIVLLIASVYVASYNRLVTLNESIDAQWAQIDNQLTRRADLIPNLVNVVKGYAKHEKDLFMYVADARTKLAGAKTMGEKMQANQMMDTALSRLLAIAENYPNLKANENFIRLQDELAGTENRVAIERMRFNEIVRDYNIMIRRFPSNIVASLSNFKQRDQYIKAEEKSKAVPKVEF